MGLISGGENFLTRATTGGGRWGSCWRGWLNIRDRDIVHVREDFKTFGICVMLRD